MARPLDVEDPGGVVRCVLALAADERDPLGLEVDLTGGTRGEGLELPSSQAQERTKAASDGPSTARRLARLSLQSLG